MAEMCNEVIRILESELHDFFIERDPCFFLNVLFDEIDQSGDVFGGSVAFVEEEVSMLRRDFCVVDRGAFEAELVDDETGGNAMNGEEARGDVDH